MGLLSYVRMKSTSESLSGIQELWITNKDSHNLWIFLSAFISFSSSRTCWTLAHSLLKSSKDTAGVFLILSSRLIANGYCGTSSYMLCLIPTKRQYTYDVPKQHFQEEKYSSWQRSLIGSQRLFFVEFQKLLC